jgi:hypothetical protein
LVRKAWLVVGGGREQALSGWVAGETDKAQGSLTLAAHMLFITQRPTLARLLIAVEKNKQTNKLYGK